MHGLDYKEMGDIKATLFDDWCKISEWGQMIINSYRTLQINCSKTFIYNI